MMAKRTRQSEDGDEEAWYGNTESDDEHVGSSRAAPRVLRPLPPDGLDFRVTKREVRQAGKQRKEEQTVEERPKATLAGIGKTRSDTRSRSNSVGPSGPAASRPNAIIDLTEAVDENDKADHYDVGSRAGQKRRFRPADEDEDSKAELVAIHKKPKLEGTAREVIDLDSDDDKEHISTNPVVDGKPVYSASSSRAIVDAKKVNSRKERLSKTSVPVSLAWQEAQEAPQDSVLDDLEEESSPLLQILSMVPDVEQKHAQNLIDKFAAYSDCVERVLDALFNDKAYPKARVPASSSRDKGKGRAGTEAKESMQEKERRFMNVKAREKPSPEYCLAAFDLLEVDFPTIPKPYIRTCLHRLTYYAPAHEDLSASLDSLNPPYEPLAHARKNKGKGAAYQDGQLNAERVFVLAKAALKAAEQAKQAAAAELEAKEEAAGHVFECGCCFGDYALSKSVQCPEAHLFCTDCARRNAEVAMADRKTAFECMDADGCKAVFTDAECSRFLKPNQISLLEKLRSEKALDEAGIVGLVKCPYCPWACVIDNPNERLFRCENEECLKITCRHCQKADHLPKTCEEHADDLKKNNIHLVEEAMTAAAVRKCPKCKRGYVKEHGCNHMKCSSCGTHSCYLCGEVIAGYQHFFNSKCYQYDKNEAHNEAKRIEAARKAAIEEVKAAAGEDAELNDEDLEKLAKDLKPPKRQRVANAGGGGGGRRHRRRGRRGLPPAMAVNPGFILNDLGANLQDFGGWLAGLVGQGGAMIFPGAQGFNVGVANGGGNAGAGANAAFPGAFPAFPFAGPAP